jgi:serpin B
MKPSIQKCLLFILLALSIAITSCAGQPAEAMAQSDLNRETKPNIGTSDLDDLYRGNQRFAFDLYHSISNSGENLFFSPYSISLALAMTYAGAQGVTEQEMADTLHFLLPQDSLHSSFNALDLDLASRGEAEEDRQAFQLNIANAIWGQDGYQFLEEFLDVLALNYGAGLRLLDFIGDSEGSREIINDWVSDQTEERIKDLIPQGAIDAMTRLVLANAIYFKADWQVQFEESGTEDAPFTLLDGSQVSIPMMSQMDPYAYAEGPGYQAIELPYYGEEISMVVFLPGEGEFDAFEQALSPEMLQGILGDLELTSLSLRMPKFEFESEFSLVKVLDELGMPSAFNEEANFSAMDGTRNLLISDVVHKAFVAVDESGTEAAAATAVIVAEMSIEITEVEMHLDRPFIFGIRDNITGTLLFLGRVMDPAS